MKTFKINTQSIHDEGFFTFETSWIGREVFDFENKQLFLPILNLDIENKQVIDYFGVSHVYIEKSYFLFKKVNKLEKNLAIHSKDRTSFVVKNFNQTIEIDNKNENAHLFEFGGMGIFQNYTYDGVLKIHCEECYFVLPENFEYKTEFKSMNDYNPFEEKWLNDFIV
mgnify:CR=1 FL=1